MVRSARTLISSASPGRAPSIATGPTPWSTGRADIGGAAALVGRNSFQTSLHRPNESMYSGSLRHRHYARSRRVGPKDQKIRFGLFLWSKQSCAFASPSDATTTFLPSRGELHCCLNRRMLRRKIKHFSSFKKTSDAAMRLLLEFVTSP